MSEHEVTIEQRIAVHIQQFQNTLLKNPKDLKSLQSILNSLKAIGSWQIINPMKELLNAPNCPLKVQQKIIEVLGTIQDPRVLSVLTAYVEHPKLRNTVIKSMSFIKSPKVTSYLISAIQEDDKWIKIFAVHGLTKNASPKVVQPLIQLLGDPEEEVRKETINSLTKLKIENVDDFLIAALESENRYIKLGAVNLLGARNVIKSVDALVSLLGSEDRRLNLIVCNTLANLSANKSLVPLLDHSIESGELSNHYLVCIQKMNDSITPSLIEVYLSDTADNYRDPIEYLLSKKGLMAHELILDRMAQEKNPEFVKKLEILEQRLEKL